MVIANNTNFITKLYRDIGNPTPAKLNRYEDSLRKKLKRRGMFLVSFNERYNDHPPELGLWIKIQVPDTLLGFFMETEEEMLQAFEVDFEEELSAKVWDLVDSIFSHKDAQYEGWDIRFVAPNKIELQFNYSGWV